MSRIGRDYLQTGFYTEVMFQKHDVRFIAISNGVDSSVQGSGEFAPFLNVMKNIHYLEKWSPRIPIIRQTHIQLHIAFILPAQQSGRIL